MRCKNCGWENADGVDRCVKCNAPLRGSMVAHNDGDEYHAHSSHQEEVLKKTVREAGGSRVERQEEQKPSAGIRSCSKCGYPLSDGMNVCPQCGKQINAGAIVDTMVRCEKCGQWKFVGGFCPHCETPARRGTVDVWRNPVNAFCTLKRIPWNNEQVEYPPFTYSGETIVLNRSNTDPNNNSITSQEQAILTHDANGWFIEDRSKLHSTYVRVSKKTRLEDGDVIVLGNRLFEFKG